MAINLVWEVKPAFPEAGKVEPSSEGQQATRPRGGRRLGRAAGLDCIQD